jgi:hypothetical protein
MTYQISLSEAGRHFYPKRNQHLERAVLFLIEAIGEEQWKSRKRAILDRQRSRLGGGRPIPAEGVSVRDREDEIGWYIHQCEQAIADPPLRGFRSGQPSHALFRRTGKEAGRAA